MINSKWLIVSCVAGLAGTAACGSSTTAGTGAGTASSTGSHATSTTSGASTSGASTSGSAATSTSSSGTGGSEASTSSGSTSTSGSTSSSSGAGGSCTGTELTVKNYLAWCTVGVNGGTASAASSQTVCVQPGTIALTATANSGFEFPASGAWHDTATSGTVAGGVDSTTVVIMSGESTKCVWVCCETEGTTDCPTTDQCP